jgi:hypothetical protein
MDKIHNKLLQMYKYRIMMLTEIEDKKKKLILIKIEFNNNKLSNNMESNHRLKILNLFLNHNSLDHNS